MFSVISVFEVIFFQTLIYSLYITPYPVFSLTLRNYAALGISDVSRAGRSRDTHGRATFGAPFSLSFDSE